jgi:hypothetical protein
MGSKEVRVMDVGSVLSWSHPAINLSRVYTRFKKDTRMFYRVYCDYLWDKTERLCPSNEPHYSHLWSQLTPGKRYVVSLEDHVHDTILGANIMQFIEYKEITETELVSARKTGIEMKIRLAKKYQEYVSELIDEGDEDPEEDESVDDIYYNCRRTVKNLRVEGAVMSCMLLRFKCLDSGRVYEMDPCGVDNFHQFHVMDIVSRGWSYVHDISTYDDGGWKHYDSDNVKAKASMRRLDAEYARHVQREVAAMRIQRQWRKAQMVPFYNLCRKRLRTEYANFRKDL